MTAETAVESVDRKWIERLRAGEAAAFDEMAAWEGPRIARLASRLLAWNPDVDDVVQVFLCELGKKSARFAATLRLGPGCKPSRSTFVAIINGGSEFGNCLSDGLATNPLPRRRRGRMRTWHNEIGCERRWRD